MTPSEYQDRVLAGLRRLTPEEREAVRRELDGHIEDHMEALRELGYDEALPRSGAWPPGRSGGSGPGAGKAVSPAVADSGTAGCGGHRGAVHPDDAGSGIVGNGLGQSSLPGSTPVKGRISIP